MRLKTCSTRHAAPLLAMALMAGAGAPARAQQTPPETASPQTAVPQTPAPEAAPPREGIDLRQFELRGVEDSLRASEERRRRIEAELEMIRTDRVRLTAAMLETAGRVQGAEGRVSAVERQLQASVGGETAIRNSLSARRGLIADLLAGMQRMGRRPPPAILISPRDILRAVRMAMTVGAVLPEIRAETEQLANDLAELVELRARIETERGRLKQEAAALMEERERLAALVDARRGSITESERALLSERERARTLARQALDLKDLIARMEAEAAGAKRAADAARKADDDRKKLAALKPDEAPRKPLTPFGDAGRLAPAIAFVDAKGLLPLPVAGEIKKAYGAPDGFGGSEKGLSIATRAGALVAAPSDGWVSFAGPYRTYGQLLILNGGDGYYVVMAGMERIGVEVGQFVLAGEPVASMGDASGKSAAAIAIGAAQPVLYVEFRKDGAAIDPGPWWAKPAFEKVRG